MSNDEDLRGSTPIYTAKDVLVSLDRKVSDMDLKLDGLTTAIQIIVSQNLNERLVHLESRGSQTAQRAILLADEHERTLSQLRGAQTAIKALVGTSVISLIASATAILAALNII